MKRADALESIYPLIKDRIVVTIMGAVAAELYNLGHQPNFFYLEHGMGLASSIGLGLALSLPNQDIIVLDGDGSVLMNMGTLSTIARYKPSNLVEIIFDNESLLSVGGFPTATGAGTNLHGIAIESGIEHTYAANDLESFKQAVAESLELDAPAVVVSKVDAVGPPSFAMDITVLENRFEFQRHIREKMS